ncbi:Putative adhesin domain-containing protein OS=Streptomyces alboniger OX=132473 GN=CP975_24155 PE=4 SV=1 [Streptomyces alboniger]
MPEWSVAEPQKLTFDTPVTTLRVRVVNGTVNVVGTDEESARLEVSELEGPPLTASLEDGVLSVAYDDLQWKSFLKRFDLTGWRRSAAVSLAVPAGTRVEVGAVGAATMVSGVGGRTEVRGVTGGTTLVGLSGPVRAETVSGSIDAQGVTGELRCVSVSGDLTVVEAAGSSVRADSVSGSLIVDLAPAAGAPEVTLTNVTGEIAVRLPHPADTEVEVDTTSGAVSTAFEDLRVSGQWGTKRVTGRLGAGSGRLRATTVSGSVALLRRPPMEEDPYGDEPYDEPPPDEAPLDPAAADGPTDKKVL